MDTEEGETMKTLPEPRDIGQWHFEALPDRLVMSSPPKNVAWTTILTGALYILLIGFGLFLLCLAGLAFLGPEQARIVYFSPDRVLQIGAGIALTWCGLMITGFAYTACNAWLYWVLDAYKPTVFDWEGRRLIHSPGHSEEFDSFNTLTVTRVYQHNPDEEIAAYVVTLGRHQRTHIGLGIQFTLHADRSVEPFLCEIAERVGVPYEAKEEKQLSSDPTEV